MTVTILGLILWVGILTVSLGEHLHHHALLASLSLAAPSPGPPAARSASESRSVQTFKTRNQLKKEGGF